MIIFSKTLEDTRNWRKFTTAKNEKKLQRILSMANLVDIHDIGENVYIYELASLKVELSRPIFIGMVVLDLAKTFMNHFHHCVMVPYFTREKIYLQYTDTGI